MNSLNCKKFVCFEIDTNRNKIASEKNYNKFDHSNFYIKIHSI